MLTRAEVLQTVDAIASVQQPDGNIPWVPGGHTDPWNLVEAAMALDVGGRFAEAERAYDWLRRMQHPEGCWHAYYEGDAGAKIETRRRLAEEQGISVASLRMRLQRLRVRLEECTTDCLARERPRAVTPTRSGSP